MARSRRILLVVDLFRWSNAQIAGLSLAINIIERCMAESRIEIEPHSAGIQCAADVVYPLPSPVSAVFICVFVAFNRWLLAHGESRQAITALMEHSCLAASATPVISLPTVPASPTVVEPTSPPVALPHDSESAWLIDCNRSEAEKMLRGKPEGTFLIRPSSDPQSFALSIV